VTGDASSARLWVHVNNFCCLMLCVYHWTCRCSGFGVTHWPWQHRVSSLSTLRKRWVWVAPRHRSLPVTPFTHHSQSVNKGYWIPVSLQG
jgi:hypothetical protein